MALTPAPRKTLVAAHVFGLTAAILMLVWLLHFRQGIDLNSSNNDYIFNVHPLLMYIGFIFLGGEAIMVHRTLWAARDDKKVVKKFIHMALHLISTSLAILGIYAVFKFHKKIGAPDVYSLHSWLGIITICLYGLQWIFGFLYFWFPRAAPSTRQKVRSLHALAGVFIFLTAICTAATGLIERFLFLRLQQQPGSPEARLINFTGLFIILYGFSVCISVIS